MKTYNAELIFSSDVQKEYWKNTLETNTEIFNYMSQIVHDENIRPSRKFVHDRLYYAVRNKWKETPSQIICDVEGEIVSTYKSLKTLSRKKLQKNENSVPKKKGFSLRLNSNTASNFSKNSISLCSGEKSKRLPVELKLYPLVEQMFDTYDYHDPLIFMRGDRFFLAVTFDTPEYSVDPNNENVLGVDLGLRRIASTSEGKIIKGNNYLKERRKIRYLKRCLRSKADKGSKSAKKHLKKLNKKEQNLSKNFCHAVANEILTTNKNIIVLEDLTKIKSSTSKTEEGYKRTKHNNRMSQVSFYTLKQILTYKAPSLHKRVETVNPSYTSQIDCRTGNQDGIRKGCRYYTIDGVILDADVNASINIAQRYCKHPLSFETAIDGSYKLKRQGSVNNPIVVFQNGKSLNL